MKKTLIEHVKTFVERYINIGEQLDTDDAAVRIKNGIWFRGPNVWILAFAIVLASVGLNVNSTAVIIGAMLVSPLMGPIIGTGLALGTNDTDLLKAALKNLLVMVVISLLASTLYFILSPLALVNPTELEARTSPTIYDVLIALFGGLAGILENSRKERGTVLSGVAIATALMPPLCTAGYGLAHGQMHFFFGALYLFIINSVFIALATYLMVIYLKFKPVTGISPEVAAQRRKLIGTVLIIVIIPSLYSAFVLVRENNFERNARIFVENNRVPGPQSYIYDYTIKGNHINVSIGGDILSDSLRQVFLNKAAQARIKEKNITILEHSFGLSQSQMDQMINDIYTRANDEIKRNEATIDALRQRIDSLSQVVSGKEKSCVFLEGAQSIYGLADGSKLTPTMALSSDGFYGNTYTKNQSISFLCFTPATYRMSVIDAPAEYADSTEALCRKAGAVAGINGSYFNMKALTPLTYIKDEGSVRGRTAPDELFRTNGTLFLGQNRFSIDANGAESQIDSLAAGWVEALSSGPILIDEGKVISYSASIPHWEDFYQHQHPRSLIGCDARDRVWMVVVDGRADGGRADGMSIAELTDLSIDLGLTDALNLDGGGSSTLWTETGGVLSHPCDNGRFDSFGQRRVPNVVAVFKR